MCRQLIQRSLLQVLILDLLRQVFDVTNYLVTGLFFKVGSFSVKLFPKEFAAGVI